MRRVLDCRKVVDICGILVYSMVFQHSVVLTVTGLTNCFFNRLYMEIALLSSLTVHVLEEKKS